MRRIYTVRSLFALVALALLCAAATAAETDSVQLEEVIVTAQKRSQNLQDVPVSVGIVTAGDLVTAQISNIQDLKSRVPGVSISSFGGTASLSYLFVRGIGNNNATNTLRAATIIDDVPLTDLFSLNNNLLDVAAIEVLRGPQSTLYGLTAEAGLIVVKSRRPGNEFSSEVAAQYSDIGDYSITGRLDVPIAADRLVLGLAGSFQKQDGFVDNQLTGDDYDRAKARTLRARLIYTPTDNLDFDLTYTHDRINDDYGQVFLPVDRAAYIARHNDPVTRASSSIPYTALAPLDDFEVAVDSAGRGDVTSDSTSLRAAWSLTGAELVSVSAYRSSNLERLFDVGTQPGAVLGGLVQSGVNPETDTTSFYQELRLASTGPGKLDWVVGGSYYDRKVITPAILIVTTAFGTVPFGDGTINNFDSRSVFGQIDYRFTDQFEGSLGLRYEKTDAESINTAGFRGFPAPNPAEIADDGAVRRKDGDIFLPRITLSYLPTDNARIYLSAARGWLSGAADADFEPGDDGIIEEETSWTYELGTKLTFADNRVRLNGAAYQTTIDDYQESSFVGPINQFLINAGKARFQGFELEAEARWGDATFSAGYSYVDAEYREFSERIGPFEIDRSGNRIAAVPNRNFSVAVNYNFTDSIYGRAEVTGAGSFLERSDRSGGRGTIVANQVVQPAFGTFDGHTVLNLKAGYESERFSLLFFANNVFDKRYFTLVTNTYALNGATDLYLLGSVGRPREVGLRATFNF